MLPANRGLTQCGGPRARLAALQAYCVPDGANKYVCVRAHDLRQEGGTNVIVEVLIASFLEQKTGGGGYVRT